MFHSPAKVVTVWGDSVAFTDILQVKKRSGATFKVTGEDIKTRLTSSWETLSTWTHPTISSKERRDTSIDVRKEKCIGGGLEPVLPPQPQMVTPDEALPAGADVGIPVIISQFESLIHPTVTVPQVRRLRRPQVSAKAFLSTW